MNKIFFTLLSMILTLTLFGQSSPRTGRPLTERQKIVREVNRKLEEGVILEFLRKCNAKIKNSEKTNEPLSSIEYSSLASSLKIWSKYRWLVADTGLSKEWLKKIYDLLIYMSKIQGYIKTAKFNGQTNTAKFKQATQYLNVSQKRFLKLMKKIVRVPVDVRQRAMKDKDMWQRAMRKKYNIKKENSSNSFF